jgi:alpha-glucosidase
LQWLDAASSGSDVVAFRSTGADRAEVTVLVNLGAAPVALPEGARVLVASGELTREGALPTDTAVWLTR